MQCRTVRSKVEAPIEASLNGRNGSMGWTTLYALSADLCRSMTWKIPTCSKPSHRCG